MEINILSAYTNLLMQKPFSQITIQNIADAALIHRSTFYTHFLDQYDLFNRLFEQKRQQAQLDLDDIFNKPFTALSSFDDAQYKQLLKFQFDDEGFRDAFFKYLISLSKDTVAPAEQLKRFLAVGRIKGITMWLMMSHQPYNLFTDNQLLDQIFLTGRLPNN